MFETKIMDVASQQGQNAIWVMLFVALLFYVLRENSKRETKYLETISSNQKIIESLSQSYECLKTSVCELSEDFKKMLGGDYRAHVRDKAKIH